MTPGSARRLSSQPRWEGLSAKPLSVRMPNRAREINHAYPGSRWRIYQANAPVRATRLSGKDIGIIKAMSSSPNARPQMIRLSDSGFTVTASELTGSILVLSLKMPTHSYNAESKRTPTSVAVCPNLVWSAGALACDRPVMSWFEIRTPPTFFSPARGVWRVRHARWKNGPLGKTSSTKGEGCAENDL